MRRAGSARRFADHVVLVHGAWHGAWCFEAVLPLLREAGVPAVALELPGHGVDGGALADLHGDAERVRQSLDTLAGPVVLVGHSYGGAVITEAGVHPAVGSLVYLAGMALDSGETCRSAAAEEAAAVGLSHGGRPDLGAALERGPDGTTTVRADAAAACFYSDCTPEVARAASARLGPQLTAALDQRPAAVAWRHRPSTYVVCRDDMAVHPRLQRLLAARCDTAVEWPTGHSPFLSRPSLVAELLVGLAAGHRPLPTTSA